MKNRLAGPVQLAVAAALVVAIILGGVLQTFTLKHAQKVTQQMRQQIVYIYANRVAQLLNDAGSGMGGFSMTRMPMYAEKFNKANEALPKAMEDLGELGPFEGAEAEAVSQLKQCASDSMGLLNRAQALLADPNANPVSRDQGYHFYTSMKNNGEKIQGCVVRLTPSGGPSAFLQQKSELESEAGSLRMLTVVWLVASLSITAGLIFVMRSRAMSG